MKKILFLAIALIASSLTFSAAADEAIQPSQLPKAARMFIAKFFPSDKVVKAEKDRDIFSVYYEVDLSSGAEINFDAKGHWQEISCKKAQSAVPTPILPQNITTYVNSNYPGQYVAKIERKYNKYEIDLSNGIELIFDKDGNFIRVD